MHFQSTRLTMQISFFFLIYYRDINYDNVSRFLASNNIFKYIATT